MAGLRQRILERHPAQQRALHPRRVLGHAREGDAVADDVLVTLDVTARLPIISPNASTIFSASRHGLTDHLVVSTEVAAWLIEQPWPS